MRVYSAIDKGGMMEDQSLLKISTVWNEVLLLYATAFISVYAC